MYGLDVKLGDHIGVVGLLRSEQKDRVTLSMDLQDLLPTVFSLPIPHVFISVYYNVHICEYVSLVCCVVM